MLHLGDTNILLRYAQPDDEVRKRIRTVIRRLKRQGHTFCASTQNYVEFWNVATRPLIRNGFGRTPAEADRMLARVATAFPFVPDSALIFPEWRRPVRKYSVSGVQVHDARLVAVMRVHGISHILTFNGTDFA